MDDDGDIDTWRRAQRHRLRAERSAMSAEQHGYGSDEIMRRLSRLLDELQGATVGLYWPVSTEFDPRPLTDRLTEQGRKVALPAVTKRHDTLEYRIWDRGMEMTNGTYGIPVPKERRLAKPNIVLVPLLGFDAANYRLGYGGGYFDRTLAVLDPRPVTVGVGFEAARLHTIFPRPHDIAMDIIVTEAGLQRQGDR
jgi:5-formyltetrahydrofolate cyclo-ligase